MRAEVKADLAEALARLRAIAAAEPDLLADGKRLAERLYASWFHDPADGRERDWPASGAFAAATALAELFEPGWAFAGWAEGGARLRRADGREEVAALGAFAPLAAAAPLLPGMPMRRLGRAAGVIDGFYHLWSEGWRAQPPPAIFRLYLPAAAGRELELAAALARHAPQALVWSAKFLCGRHGAGRRDPALLYLPRGDEDAGWVRVLLDAAAPLLGGPRVRMAASHRGAWLAADPGGGLSFGQALVRALAEVAREPGALAGPEALAYALAVRLDLEAPHLLRPGGSA